MGLPKNNLLGGDIYFLGGGLRAPSDLLYFFNISNWGYFQQVCKRATHQKFFSASQGCAKLTDWRKNGQKWRFLHIFDDLWPSDSNEHWIILNSISPHGLLVISVIHTKNVAFKSVKNSNFVPKWPFFYIFGGKWGPYTLFSDFIRRNMANLGDTHGVLIETHKIIPIVILDIPPVTHSEAWIGDSVCVYWEKWLINGLKWGPWVRSGWKLKEFQFSK